MAKLNLTTTWQEVSDRGIVCTGVAGGKKIELFVGTSIPTGDVDDSFTVDQSAAFLYPIPMVGRFYARVSSGTGILKYYEV